MQNLENYMMNSRSNNNMKWYIGGGVVLVLLVVLIVVLTNNKSNEGYGESCETDEQCVSGTCDCGFLGCIFGNTGTCVSNEGYEDGKCQ